MDISSKLFMHIPDQKFIVFFWQQKFEHRRNCNCSSKSMYDFPNLSTGMFSVINFAYLAEIFALRFLVKLFTKLFIKSSFKIRTS